VSVFRSLGGGLGLLFPVYHSASTIIWRGPALMLYKHVFLSLSPYTCTLCPPMFSFDPFVVGLAPSCNCWRKDSIRSNRIFLGAYHHRFRSKHKKGTLWWKAGRSARNARCGTRQRRWNQDAVQVDCATSWTLVHFTESPTKGVQQEWFRTGKMADAVGSAFQTTGRW